MKNGIKRIACVGVFIIPCLLLSMLFAQSFAKPSTFYYLGWNDGQHYVFRHVAREVIHDNTVSRPSGNEPINSFYYPELRAAGFNFTATQFVDDSLLSDSSIFSGMHVLYAPEYIHEYTHAQYTFFDVGGDDAFFPNPHDITAGKTISGEDGGVFHSEVGSNSEGFLIKTSLWKRYHMMNERVYHLELRVKAWDSAAPADICHITIARREWNNATDQYDTSNVNTYKLKTSDLAGDNIWTTVRFSTSDRFNPKGFETIVRIKWLANVNLELDWMRIFDNHYCLLAIDTSQAIYDSICADAQHWGNNNIVAGFWCDEPWPSQWKAIRIVDSLVYNTINKHIFVDFNDWHQDWVRKFIRTVDLDILPTFIFVLNDSVSHSSVIDTSNPANACSLSLQVAWDRLIHWEGYFQNRNFEENYMGKGLRTYAEVVDSAGIQWLNITGACNEWNYEGHGKWVKWFRAPIRNELFCQVYLSLAFGAQGVGYYAVGPMYFGWRDPDDPTGERIRIVLNPNNDGEDNEGLFSLVNDQGNIPKSKEFPEVFHSGRLVPNSMYDYVQEVNRELDIIDDMLLELEWDNSFCSADSQRYKYIDSVWTEEDSLPDTTFIQVGVFHWPQYPEGKYLMLVNRRCLDHETRSVHVRLDFGGENGGKRFFANCCFEPRDFRMIADADGKGEFRAVIEPGHGKLFRISKYRHYH
jgi:hypothetical protein